MLAVSAFADGKGPAPWELTEALLCREFGSFPEAGGLEAQDMTVLARQTELVNIYRVCMTFNQGGWKALSGADQAVIAEIAELEHERADS